MTLSGSGSSTSSTATLSAFVHPGIPLAERYVESHEPLEIRLTPRPVSDPTTWLYPTCCALIWAARAVDVLDRSHRRARRRPARRVGGRRPNREFLRAQARRLDIPVQMKLTDVAVRRSIADRDRRLAKRAAGS
jgi:hypothetical protein